MSAEFKVNMDNASYPDDNADTKCRICGKRNTHTEYHSNGYRYIVTIFCRDCRNLDKLEVKLK